MMFSLQQLKQHNFWQTSEDVSSRATKERSDICITERPDICITETPDICITERPDICITERPDICITERPDICITGFLWLFRFNTVAISDSFCTAETDHMLYKHVHVAYYVLLCLLVICTCELLAFDLLLFLS